MATMSSLTSQLRSEIGDVGKSFVWQTVADGLTNRYEIPHAPVDGPTLIVQVDGVNVPDSCAIEENTGFLTFDEIPVEGALIVVGGTTYRYFTDSEIAGFITTAFSQHANTSVDPNGRKYTLSTMPPVEDYAVVILAATNALYTLATDASFDIDIAAPDGVMIPRSQRYRQLMDMIATRKDQYRDLCVSLGIGMYRIEVALLRRISMKTNRLAPIYLPQEIDDRSVPQRVFLPRPTYGSQPLPSVAAMLDLTMKQGDDFILPIDFPVDLTGYNIDAQIKLLAGKASPILLCFTIDVTDIVNGIGTISLTGAETALLPERTVWELQLTDPNGIQTTYLAGNVYCEREITRSGDPYASGWRG